MSGGAPHTHSQDDDAAPLELPKKKHVDSEGIWLISYSDLMTLLMGFFALMLSMSTLDDKKSDAVREATTEYFGGEFKRPFEDLAAGLGDMIKKEGLGDQVRVESDASSVTLIFRGTLLFDSGSVELKADAQALFDKIIPLIKKQASGYFLLFEGHTDDVPIAQTHIPSNWELSGFRAGTIARKFESFAFDRAKMMVVGWGETRPLVPNKDPNGSPNSENQSQNRRVSIKVLKSPVM